MPVTEIVRALGSWSLDLTDRAPQEIVDLLDDNRYGHIAVDAARDNPAVQGDALLTTARYVGVLRGSSHANGVTSLAGSGNGFWLGAEDGLGDVLEAPVAFSGATFAAAVAALLPPAGAVVAGTITTPPGATPYTGSHRYQTSRQAIDYVADLYSCDWRVNGDWTLDAGRPEDLFVTDPRAAVIARAEGLDMRLRALPGAARFDSDVNDFSTRVVTLAEGEGTSIQVGTADIAVNPHLDPRGNPLKLTRLVSESNTAATNADARAAVVLAKFTSPRDQVSLSSSTHDIRGDVQPGDSVWVYDPAAGLVDHNNEITFRGDRISPVKLRVFQINWPVERGMGVYFRTTAGVWIDLTDYVQWESGEVGLTVGGYDRALTNTGESVSFRPNLPAGEADSSIPGATTFNTPFTQAVYLGTSGLTRAQVQVSWDPPATNTDGSPFVDGSNYELRYRVAPVESSTWAQAAAKQWDQLSTWGAPVPTPAGSWQTVYAPIDTTTYLIQELTPGIKYQFQIRAVDAASPPNVGAYSALHEEFILDDTIAPPIPAAPVVAGSLVQISVRHLLGAASGGTFNLPLDLAYLEVHVGSTAGFTPSDSTRVGKIIATRAQINGQIPVIGTFPVATPDTVYVRVLAVDQAGNESDPSASAAVTTVLIDSQWVGNLTADVITAGNFTASYGLIGLLTAGTPGGQRFEAGDNGTLNGFRLYRPSGTLSLSGDAATGDLRLFAVDGTTATLQFTAATGLIDLRGKMTAGVSFTSGARVVVDPAYATPGGSEFPSVVLYSAAGAFGPARMNATDQSGGQTALGINSGPTTAGSSFEQTTLFLFPQTLYLSVNAGDGGVSATRGGLVVLDSGWAELRWAPAGVKRSGVVADTNGARLTGRNSSGVELAYVKVTPSGGAEMAGNVVLFGNGGSVLDMSGSGDVQLFSNNGNNINITDSTITASVPFGSTGGGFGFHAQGGASGGYRFAASGGFLRFVDNDANLFLSDPNGPGGLKCFVIDHPVDPDRWLVHSCTESPTAGVEYSETAVIGSAGTAWVELPGYFEALTRLDGRQVFLTVVAADEPGAVPAVEPEVPLQGPTGPGHPLPSPVPGSPAIPEHTLIPRVAASLPRDGRFRIVGPPGTQVSWLVKAIRRDVPPLVTEPLRSTVKVDGFGPYRTTSPLSLE